MSLDSVLDLGALTRLKIHNGHSALRQNYIFLATFLTNENRGLPSRSLSKIAEIVNDGTGKWLVFGILDGNLKEKRVVNRQAIAGIEGVGIEATGKDAANYV